MKRILLSATLSFLISMSFHLCFAVEDTVEVGMIGPAPANSSVAVDVRLFNDENIGGFTIPLSFDTTVSLDVTCDSIHWSSRFWTNLPYAYAGDGPISDYIDDANNKLNIWAVWGTDTLPPGNGVIATIHFTTGPGWNETDKVYLNPTSYGANSGIVLSSLDGYELDFEFLGGVTGIRELEEPGEAIPEVFNLSQNYPNPFNPQTIIRFTLPSDTWVKVEVFNILGQRVKTLVDQHLSAGAKEVSWDGKNSKGVEVGSGIYFYRIQTKEFTDVRRMVLLK
jgi:hypothetical protein